MARSLEISSKGHIHIPIEKMDELNAQVRAMRCHGPEAP